MKNCALGLAASKKIATIMIGKPTRAVMVGVTTVLVMAMETIIT